MSAEAPATKREKTEAEKAEQITRIGNKLFQRAESLPTPYIKPEVYGSDQLSELGSDNELFFRNEGAMGTPGKIVSHKRRVQGSEGQQDIHTDLYNEEVDGIGILKNVYSGVKDNIVQRADLEVGASPGGRVYGRAGSDKLSKEDSLHATASLLSDLRGEISGRGLQADQAEKKRAKQKMDEILKA